jgi:hypothetical protein
VETGTSLSVAFRKFPLYFDALYCNLVEAGESAGILDQLLDRLAVYMEKTEAIKSKIKSALMYPISVLIVAFVVVGRDHDFCDSFFQTGVHVVWWRAADADADGDCHERVFHQVLVSDFWRHRWWCLLLSWSRGNATRKCKR